METKLVTNPLQGDTPDLVLNMLQEPAEEQVSIIVVHKDRPEHLNICLQSIAVTSLNNNYEIIVVDNGSKIKDAVDFIDELDEQGEVKVVKNKENLYWSKAANQGVKAADKKSKYFIFLHHDVVITNPAWIDLLLNISESQNSGLVGVSLSSFMLDRQRVEFISGEAFLTLREAYEDVGGFCEELPVIGWDFLYTIACQMSGWSPQLVKNNLLHHYSIFSFDTNYFEIAVETAHKTLPRLMRDIQTKVKKRKR